jgi:hypothetical protein
MSAHQAEFPIQTMARVLKVSASGYYAWRNRPASTRATADADLTRRIRTIHAGSRATYGAPRVHAELAAGGVHVGRKRVARLMRGAGLAGVSRRRSAPVTTVRDLDHRPAHDLVRRNFAAVGPNELWVADITFLPTMTGFLYLAVVLDAWSRRIVGWAFSADLKTRVVLDALDMALAARKPDSVIHHSDRGSQGGFKRPSQHGHWVLCQASVKRFGRGFPAEGFSWSRVEGCGNRGERLGAVHAQVRALREVLAQQPIGVLVGAALPRALRIAEVDLNACIDFERRMLGHLGALVPGERAPKFLRQRYDGPRNSIANSLGAMPRESRSILDSQRVAMTVQSWQMQKHRKASCALDERAYCRTAKPQNEVALPVPRNRPVIGLCRALADHDLG